MLGNQGIIIHEEGEFPAALFREHVTAEVEIKWGLNLNLALKCHSMAERGPAAGKPFSKPWWPPRSPWTFPSSRMINVSVLEHTGKGTEDGPTNRGTRIDRLLTYAATTLIALLRGGLHHEIRTPEGCGNSSTSSGG